MKSQNVIEHRKVTTKELSYQSNILKENSTTI